MTKAESFIYNSPNWKRNPTKDYTKQKHNGDDYNVRVYEHAELWELHCDNYYGRSMLYYDGRIVRDVEREYDTALARLV